MTTETGRDAKQGPRQAAIRVFAGIAIAMTALTTLMLASRPADAMVGVSVSAVDAAAGERDANAVELHDLAETYHRLGAAFAEHGRFRQALEYFRIAHRLAPEDATFEATLQRLLAAPELKWAYE